MKKTFVFRKLSGLLFLTLMLAAIFIFGSCSGEHTHSYTEMTVLQASTCSECGVQKASCECGDFIVVELPKTAHTEGEWKTLYEASCITGGTKQLFCSVCDEVVRSESIPALGHDLVDVERKEATCSEAGYEAYKACSRCSYTTSYKRISPKAHTYDPQSIYPTCTEDLTCDVCGEVVKAATGHYEVVTPGKAATCTSDGTTDYIECFKCKMVVQESVKIPKREHTIVDIPAEASTCSSVGKTAAKQCSECGYYEVYPLYISKIPHTYSNKYSTTCSVCGEVKSSEARVCDHSKQGTILGMAATCSKYGVTAGTECTVCGTVIKGQSVIEPLSHTVETVKAVAPTQTSPGLTEGTKCSVCGVIIKQQEVIPPLSMTDETSEE